MKNHKLIKYNVILLLFFVVGLYSCKTGQKMTQAESPLTEKTDSELFKDILYKELHFDTFSSKLNMTISTGTKTISSKGNLRIINNEALQVSVQPLFGIEMFRLYVQPEYFIILDRMNKRYVKESFSDLEEKNPIGFNFYT